MPPAARVGDMHVCPMVTPGVPPVPHVGGPILPPGAPTVLIGMMPAARVGDMAVCVGPPDVIVVGSFTVLIGGMPAARVGDSTAHGGTITLGYPTVMIGSSGSGGGGGGGGGASGAGGGVPLLTEARGPGMDTDFASVFSLAGLLSDAFAGAAKLGSALVSLGESIAGAVSRLVDAVIPRSETYADGITLYGTSGFRDQARKSLDEMGQTRTGKVLFAGIKASGKTVTIKSTDDDNGYCQADSYTDAIYKSKVPASQSGPSMPGAGSDSTIEWNPQKTTLEPGDSPGATVILGHEMVHAYHNASGTNGNGPYDKYGGQTSGSARGEERSTVGVSGTQIVDPAGNAAAVPDHSSDVPTENSLRDDLSIPRRQSYYPANWPGGAPW